MFTRFHGIERHGTTARSVILHQYDIIDVMRTHGETIYGLLRHLRPIVLDSARVVDEGVRQTGWTVASRAVMEVLTESGPATVPAIAARLGLARQNVQRCIDGLSKLGHVTRTANPAHARSVLIEVTECGREAFDNLHSQELRALDAVATECSTGDIVTAINVLTVLERDIRERAEQSRKADECTPNA